MQQLDDSRCASLIVEKKNQRSVARRRGQGRDSLHRSGLRATLSAPHRQQLSQSHWALCTTRSTQPGVRRLGG